MAKIGLKTPITIRAATRVRDGQQADVWEIVAGRHRVAAARSLGWAEIEAVTDEGDTTLWTIAENLHRAELSDEERGRLVRQWADRTGEVSGQIDRKPAGGRPVGGISKAARELGIPERQARRDVQAANRADGIAPAARPVSPPREPQNDLEVVSKQVDAAASDGDESTQRLKPVRHLHHPET